MKPTIESSLRDAIDSLRVAQELTKGQMDRAIGRTNSMAWGEVLERTDDLMWAVQMALNYMRTHCTVNKE